MPMAAVQSPSKLQETLDALQRTSKGRLKYNEDDILQTADDKPANENRRQVSALHSRPTTHRQLTGQEVSSMLKGTALVTVNSIYNDDEPSVTQSTQRRQYFLDVDNSQCSLLDVSTCSESSATDSSLEPEVQESLSSSSIEEVAIRELDTVYNRQLQDKISERQSAYLKGLSAIDYEFSQRFQELELSHDQQHIQKLEEIEEEFDLGERLFEERLEKLRQQNREDAQALNESLETFQKQTKKEVEKRIEEERIAKEREEQKRRRIRAECESHVREFDRNEQVVVEMLNSEIFAEIEAAQPFVNKGREVAADIRHRVNAAMTRPTAAATVARLKDCIDTLRKLTDSVDNQLKRVELLKKRQDQERSQHRLQEEQRQQQIEEQRQQEEQRQRQEEQLRQRQQQQSIQASQRPATRPSQPAAINPQQAQAPAAKELSDMCCLEDTFIEFMRLNELIGQAQEAGKLLSTNPQHKKLRMELQKAVSITINAISALGGRHVKEKLRTLTKLIRGETVRVGNRSVSTHGIPAAVIFCQNLIAKKLVEQADSQVSSNAKAAFPFAVVMVSMMNESRDMKDLILGYFYIQCPYLVPYYPTKQQGQSTEEYFSHLGYKLLDSGEIEAQDLFIKRMTGYTKLFASCMISQGVDGVENESLDMASAWMLLVRLVSLKPRPATTATILSSLLSVCGCRLIQFYGTQARKLLQFLLVQFLPAINEATQVAEVEGDGGATERLEQSLIDLLNRQRLDDPEGYIKRSFWYT